MVSDAGDDRVILVTGATGFIGRHLTDALARSGARVRALVRSLEKGRSVLPTSVDLCVGDVLDGESVRRAVEGCRMVIHLANIIPRAGTAGEPVEDVNVAGTRIVVDAALNARVDRFLHVSSVAVYGHAGMGERTEDSPTAPGGDSYSRTKYLAERVVRSAILEAALPAIILRPGAIYGPYDEGWTLTPLRMIKSGRLALPFGGRGLIQPLYVTDLVDGLIRSLERGRIGEVYILTGTEVVTIKSFFSRLGGMIGRPRIRTIPGWLALAAAGVIERFAKLARKRPLVTREQVRYAARRMTFSHDKANRELGFKPAVRLEEGLGNVEEWLRREAPLQD